VQLRPSRILRRIERDWSHGKIKDIQQ
jgi:hypothetical protein